MMDYDALRAEQKALRPKGIHRGIGFASFIEVTNPSAAFYGVGGARISSQDGATLRLDAQGAVICHSGVTEQGQGAEAVVAQCVASAFGVPIERVRVVTGDTDATPYGGGTWASRAAGIGGEAAWQAGKALRQNVLATAASILQAKPETLDIRDGIVVDSDTGRERIGLDEVARIAYFRPDTLPPGFQAEMMAVRHYVPRKWPFAFTNGIQASYLEVDTDSGFVTLLKHWCVEDCGTVINPQLVDEQVRGGIVQGIGGALFEHCIYDERGQLLNGNMADYLVPMAAEMPDIEVGHVVSPTADSELGAKGAGEAGTAGAPGAVMNALNDALRPLGAEPLTPPCRSPPTASCGRWDGFSGQAVARMKRSGMRERQPRSFAGGSIRRATDRPNRHLRRRRGRPNSAATELAEGKEDRTDDHHGEQEGDRRSLGKAQELGPLGQGRADRNPQPHPPRGRGGRRLPHPHGKDFRARHSARPHRPADRPVRRPLESDPHHAGHRHRRHRGTAGRDRMAAALTPTTPSTCRCNARPIAGTCARPHLLRGQDV